MKSDRRRKEQSKRRAAKKAQFDVAKARGDVGGASEYAQKIARKHGSGRVDPSWMWWIARETAP